MQLYKISFKTTDKCYIGITSKTAEIRFRKHKGKGTKIAISSAIRKHGINNTILTVIAECDNWELLCLAEKEAIEKFNTKYPNGYNIADGGMGAHGRKISEDEREKRRLYFVNNPEALERNRQKIINYYNENPEARQKVTDKLLERFSTEESRQKHSEAMKKRFVDNPDLYNVLSKNSKEYYSKQENRDLMSAKKKKYYAENPDALIKMSKNAKKQFSTKESRIKASLAKKTS